MSVLHIADIDPAQSVWPGGRFVRLDHVRQLENVPGRPVAVENATAGQLLVDLHDYRKLHPGSLD